jgi:hypothetical protein
MADIRDLPRGTHVLVYLKVPEIDATLHRGVVVELDGQWRRSPDTVCVELTPPLPDPRNPDTAILRLTCEAKRLQLDLGSI